jgi:hypothetical protein
VFILVTVFLSGVGIGLIIPVLPQLITELAGGSISPSAGEPSTRGARTRSAASAGCGPTPVYPRWRSSR